MLIVTSGDPYGINIELLLRCGIPVLGGVPTLVIGSAWHWRDQAHRLGMALPTFRFVTSGDAAQPGDLSFLDIGSAAEEVPAECLSEKQRGDLTLRALAAIPAAKTSQSIAVVTGPIDKHASHLAGFAFPGQTEFFEHLWGSEAVMTLAGPRLIVGLATNHHPLSEVPGILTASRVQKKLTLFVQTLREAFGKKTPRIAVAGLNPHAGDQGLFGNEDRDILTPAIEAVKKAEPHAVIVGPLPADTVFYHAYRGMYDGVLAMYHDQGLGPLKTVHFDDAINLSGGLRHLRVSPDHGPARDLFLKGQASTASMKAALDTACHYLSQRGHQA